MQNGQCAKRCLIETVAKYTNIITSINYLRSGIFSFFHPDSTVGSGLEPDPPAQQFSMLLRLTCKIPRVMAISTSTGETGRGLLVRTRATAGREFHPAPKERHIQLGIILHHFSLSGNAGGVMPCSRVQKYRAEWYL